MSASAGVASGERHQACAPPSSASASGDHGDVGSLLDDLDARGVVGGVGSPGADDEKERVTSDSGRRTTDRAALQSV